MKMLLRLTKAQFHWSWFLAPLWMAVMLGLLFRRHQLPNYRSVQDLFDAFEYFLPLAAAVLLAGVPAFEREEGAAETHLGYIHLPSVRLGLLALPRLAVWAATAGAALIVVSGWYLPDQTWTLVKVLAPTALALGGAALAGAALTRSQLGGIIAAFFWWVLDATGSGLFNKRFFLFPASVRTGLFTPEAQARNIALVGAACLLLTLWLAHRRSHWIK